MKQLRDFQGLTDLIEHELRLRPSVQQAGKVIEVTGTLIRATGIEVKLGEMCELRSPEGKLLQYAEVVGFAQNVAILSPFGSLTHLSRATRVMGLGRPLSVKVGPQLLGRVIDALGAPIDQRGPLEYEALRPILADPPDPMSRRLIDEPFYTGVRAVDAFMTFGDGQRVGVFAPAGVGKSTLMGMFARGSACDVSVIALIGERGREVREFIEQILGETALARSVVVCATSDRSSIERAKASYVATTIAEYFRDQGLRVLLMMDSLTRFARAQREIGLAAGEPPTRRGFPPSLFAELPRLLERAGTSDKGSITALYTVLMEDEDSSDPVAEEVRSILDGHIILSREIAARNQYPAIDVLGSLSRVMHQVTPESHREAAARVRRLLAKHREVETLLQLGEYQPGSDPVADEAISKIEAIRSLLTQRTDALADPMETIETLQELVSE
ncbi:type III secretion system ATPase SctN [Mycoavidus sp. B2-EB]|uniref:type III secretion system ATPase SctN n=1 Tax=Mycoavidus sp. B2-EB TaxID=2651972 RepID=UPI00162449C4|nr:type III secretion system ATPase SctN [Mycoavidus sp. B2-EB]BBO60051.1 EscN/YscN/HrcN family type III secretion system ATPase [Mycoavidus sp. B2-EB]